MNHCEVEKELIFIPIAGPIGPTGNVGPTGIMGPTGQVSNLLFRAERLNTTNIIVTNNTVIDVEFNSTNINNGYTFDGTTLTIPYNGYYKIESQIMMAEPILQTGRREILLNVNNIIYHGSHAPAGGNEFVTPYCNTILQLNAGDLVKIQTYQNAGIGSSVQIIANDIVDNKEHDIK